VKDTKLVAREGKGCHEMRCDSWMINHLYVKAWEFQKKEFLDMNVEIPINDKGISRPVWSRKW
jgi:hypothetical protein